MIRLREIFINTFFSKFSLVYQILLGSTGVTALVLTTVPLIVALLIKVAVWPIRCFLYVMLSNLTKGLFAIRRYLRPLIYFSSIDHLPSMAQCYIWREEHV